MKISVVSYLNSKPFIYGLEKNPHPDWKISLDIPSECARKLLAGEIDIGLVPVAALKSLPGYHIVSPYCIGADGAVDSVKLYSEVPLEQITDILLDYQSRTSIELVQVLARELWHINPRWIKTMDSYEKDIRGTTAGVIIGDRTFRMDDLFVHSYDLSAEWKRLTGLPFVFAVWACSGKNVDVNSGRFVAFENEFSAALSFGIQNIDRVVQQYGPEYQEWDIKTYLTERIKYRLTPALRSGMETFLRKMA